MIFVILGILLMFLGSSITMYNRFKSLDLQAEAALSNIDVALSKRYDTLSNMVEVVKGYAKHEKDVLVSITKARKDSLEGMSDADERQSSEMRQLLALAEAYPDLKADTNFLHLQKVIADVEEHLQAARRLYNQSVKEFNTGLQTFPSNIIGSMMNLVAKPFYKA
ncbi:MAG: LemA family protein, partial [Erysipelotrichaceae bacterium]|nr:LemA family protein [Erysipelotrichaceae bacterium]